MVHTGTLTMAGSIFVGTSKPRKSFRRATHPSSRGTETASRVAGMGGEEFAPYPARTTGPVRGVFPGPMAAGGEISPTGRPPEASGPRSLLRVETTTIRARIPTTLATTEIANFQWRRWDFG